MTTIEYGGGPTLEQRRQFSGLQDGQQVPGYKGYCPQLKFNAGKTYGNETLDLYNASHVTVPQPGGVGSTGKYQIQNQLPVSNGDNKYTQDMVPGYSGYIPRWPFKFGDTYKNECDICLDEFLTNCNKQNTLLEDVRQSVASRNGMRPIRGDPEVRDRLNQFGEFHFTHKRALTEPPMPGYTGFAPRIYTTELGLGCRYHDMTKNGFEAFSAEMERTGGRRGSKTSRETISVNRMPSAGKTRSPQISANFGKRLYVQDGMIPKYTGYLPQKRYNIGHTYGDTSRELDVCAHDQACYGDFMKVQGHAQEATYA